MKKTFSIIRNFFHQNVPVETLGFYRIVISGFALIQFLVLLPDWMLFYGPEGMMPWPISEALASNYMPTLSAVTKLFSPIGMSANGSVYLVTVIYVISLIGLFVGFKTRLMGLLAWSMHLIINTTGNLTAYGVETFTHIALFYCAVLPVGASWSRDNLKKPKQLPAYLITLSVRIIQLHLCIMYFSSGFEKALGDQWWNGEAIWIALQQDQFNQVDIGWMARVPWIPKLLGWGTLALETLYPIGILWPKTKRFWLTGILMMHFGIAVFLGLHLFGGLMILLNVAAFAQHCFPGFYKMRTSGRVSEGDNAEIKLARVYKAG